MIIVNPNLRGKKTAELSKKDFPHLYNEQGEEIRGTYIYMLYNDVIVESIESAKVIQEKTRDFIAHKIECLRAELLVKNQTIKDLETML